MTDEEMKKYVDDHWISVTYCHECRHMCMNTMPSGHRFSSCDMLRMPVSKTFWCAFGEKKR